MTPLMKWIAMGKQRKVGVDKKVKEKSEKSKRSKRKGDGSFTKRSRSDVHRKSLRELAGGPQESGRISGGLPAQLMDRKARQSKRQNQKSPQMLEISLPQMRDMQDDTIEPLQKFFEDQHFDAWHFNVFELEKLTKNHSLWFLGMILFEHYKIVDIFQINQAKLSNFLLNLEENYCYDKSAPNPYHNHIHAADVLQTVAHFSTCGPIQKRLRVIHGFALFVAAMGHDYKHPGRTNAFLIHTQNEIAITYNDMSVLENFHAASLFKVLLEEDTNILSGMDNKELRTFRNMCVKTILATDLATGFEYVGLFKSHVTTGHAFDSEESKLLLMALIMKVADVSHPCKQWGVHLQWSDRISEEFFLQGDLETLNGMPISPLCDRSKHYLPKSQCDFVDYVVRPCVDVFSEYCKSDLWKDTMQSNYDKWKGMIEEDKQKKESGGG
jgi:calcium/calmodulin-dependent 3',5'-cyclic nucleotide phosphodiesterase